MYILQHFVLMLCMGQGRKSKPGIDQEQLQSWKLLQDFRTLLDQTSPAPCQTIKTGKGGPRRLLHEEDYLCSFLFAQFNPVIDSMRGLCACSRFQKVQDIVCRRSMRLGSFSEAQSVFGFERLEKVFEKLAAENISRPSQKKKIPPGLAKSLRLVDSSTFYALPRMAWAHWRVHYGTKQSAVRLHIKFSLFDEKPSGALVKPAKTCERKALEKMIQPGEFYVGDRYYGRDYKFLERLDEAGCSYLMRLYESAFIKEERNLPLTDGDIRAGVVSDRIVRLGSRKCWHLKSVRVIRIEKPELGEPVLLVTNQTDPNDLAAGLLADIYHRRWEIELFFRWLKCIFSKPKQWHWFAESAEGVGIQLYCALIAALLLSRRLGKIPNKRTMEALHWHQLGMINTDELAWAIGQKSS